MKIAEGHHRRRFSCNEMTNIPKFLHMNPLLPFFRKIFTPPDNAIVSLPAHQIKFCITDVKDRMQSIIYYFNEYEPHITKLIIDNLSEGGCFFDIGSSTGYFSLIAAKRVGPQGKVHAFEPLPRNFEVLKKNSSINKFDNVVINNTVVTDRIGNVTFYPPNNPDEWGTGSIFGGNEKEAFTMPSITLEYYIKSRNLKAIDLVKIDTEGSELKIINGLKPIIADVGYPKIICEINEAWLRLADSQPRDLIRMLIDLGYRVYKINRRGLAPIGNNFDSVFNIFAVR